MEGAGPGIYRTSLWAVGPPLFFFFEFHYVRSYFPELLQNTKESQELASRVWAGMTAALGFLFVRKD
jgi:hypothetical protein